MKDRSLVAFTLLSQAAVGGFWTLGALYIWSAREGLSTASELTALGWPVIGLIMGLGLLASISHLGAPTNAWRALGNLRRSWLSREILLASLFTGSALLFAVLQGYDLGPLVVRVALGGGAGLVGLALIYAMSRVYCLRTIPAWNTWTTPASFFTTTFLLGGLTAGVVLVRPSRVPVEWMEPIWHGIALWTMTLLAVDLALVPLWTAQLKGSDAATDSRIQITRRHRAMFYLRLAFAAGGMLATSGMLKTGEAWLSTPGLVFVAFGLALLSQVLGRMLFYLARVRHGV